MKKIILLLLTVTLILILPGCKKLVEGLVPNIPIDSIPTVPDPTKPTQTDVGVPFGNIVTKTIGTGGGSIASADGNAELIFPAGALDNNTNISVQALTQTAPNGIGNAYQFLPNGIKFKQPVTLKFHYTADDLAATIGDLMGVAFQDSVGGWWGVKNITNDTANKIISASIKHFTGYTPFGSLKIKPVKGDLKVGASMDLNIDLVSVDDDTNDDELFPLVTLKNKNVLWSVNGVANGNSTFGTVAGNSLSATFTAPAKAPKQNPVTVSATIDLNFKYQGKTFTKGTLLSNIRILDGEKYLLEIRQYENPPFFEYKDSASLIVLVNADGTVTIPDITNFEPEVTPASITQGDCTMTFVPDGIGVINITNVTGTITGKFGDATRQLILEFTHTGAALPKFRSECNGGDASTDGGQEAVGFPTQLIFTLTPDGGAYFVTDGDTLTRLTLQD